MIKHDATPKEIPIDIPSVLERIGGDRSFLEELLDLYQLDFMEKFSLLRQAVEEKNFISIQEIGHGLKGASANLSLLELQGISYNLERAGRENDIDLAVLSLRDMEEGFRNLKLYLVKREPGAENP